MSDTTSEHDDLSTTQEYTIAGIVILLFAALYWLFNHGSPDISFNTREAQPTAAIVAADGQAAPNTQLSADKNKPVANTGLENPDGNSSTQDNKQQFVIKQEAGSVAANAGQQAPTAQSAAADSSMASSMTEGSAETIQSDGSTTQSTVESTDAQVIQTTSAGSGNSATKDVNTANAVSSTVTNTVTSSSNSAAQQQTQSNDTATNSLAQRVITDPAVLTLRDHLLNNELETPVLMDSVSFVDQSYQAELSTDTQLLDLAALMLQNPAAKMLIRGHTATEGSIAGSKQLSLKRATAVGQKLVETGAQAGNIIIMGIGDAEPLSNDNNQQNRGKNRRIDVAITQ